MDRCSMAPDGKTRFSVLLSAKIIVSVFREVIRRDLICTQEVTWINKVL